VRRWLVGLLAAGGVAALARRRRALTPDGALAATLLGGLVFARGRRPAAVALNVFFVSSSLLSRVGAGRKAARSALAQAKGAERDAWQVLANGGPAALGLVLGGRRAEGAFLGALAAAAADTWATEIGLYAGQRPRLVTTLRPVPAGASGGVTPVGLAASAAGAAAVGTSWALAAPRGRSWRLVLATTLAGAAGALVDSLLGATVQAGYWCRSCGLPTESRRHARCGQPTIRTRGLAWVDNDVVNAAATSAGAVIGALAIRPRYDAPQP
jgi:uncharacterized protein (TIGR00297 family)